ncbi:KGGVGR-motif variant AAA ATPase [Sphingopyxis chilensis]|uniref:KGGVGR-motif variant AAA ATPase n=1 Tax=Sphingopyxis chilensis TaxID=180400 RepID=UPI002DDCA404|nr:AAA family ATPase [Sphingopyxis chilensis]
MSLTYDFSLSQMVDIVMDKWGETAIAENLFLRDASGRLTFVVLDASRSGVQREALSAIINNELGAYADPSGISVATPDELFDETLNDLSLGTKFPIKGALYEGHVRLLDRRVVGADWLRAPAKESPTIPRLFFVSLKGGVGRSTALCVLAAHLATIGLRVLAVDLDLEAPGLGTMLLDPDTTPKFGVLDYLVETNVGEVDDKFVADMLGPSQLASGRGAVTVIPALGSVATEYPENVLSKIARAYLPSDNDSGLASFTAKIEKLLDVVVSSNNYDVVLVDARAGLHESTAAAAVSLRGETLLFGMNQPQTYAGYRALFSQLSVTLGTEWVNHLHLVEARVGANGPTSDFLSNMVGIMPSPRGPSEPLGIPFDQLRENFAVEWDETIPDSESDALLDPEIDSTFIYESEMFHGFDPLKHPDRLDRGVYSIVFESFLARCEEILESEDLALAESNYAER